MLVASSHPPCICEHLFSQWLGKVHWDVSSSIRLFGRVTLGFFRSRVSYLVDPASSHMLVPKIKPCMSKYKPLYTGETANGSLYQLSFT